MHRLNRQQYAYILGMLHSAYSDVVRTDYDEGMRLWYCAEVAHMHAHLSSRAYRSVYVPGLGVVSFS